MDKQIKEMLNRAVDHLPHPDAGELWDTPVQKMVVHDHITLSELPPRRRTVQPAMRLAVSFVCLVLVVLGGLGWYFQNGRVDAVICLDVNPSFEITVNRRQSVLSVEGRNQEAEALLAGRDYRGWDIEATVETLMRTLDDRQYLTENAENAVLLSVNGRDLSRADDLGQRLSLRIRESVDSPQTPTTVLRQSYVEAEQDSADLAGVSAGKLRLARSLVDQLPGRSVEQLAALPMEELERLVLRSGLGSESLLIDRSAWAKDAAENNGHGDDPDNAQKDVAKSASSEQPVLPSAESVWDDDDDDFYDDGYDDDDDNFYDDDYDDDDDSPDDDDDIDDDDD